MPAREQEVRARVREVLGLMREPLDRDIDRAIGREISLRGGDVDAVIAGRIDRLGNDYVISVDVIDPVEGTRRQSFNSADTLVLTSLPYTTTIQLTELASIVVEVSNPAVTPATVRLRVEVDSGQQPYDREAIMSEGGALRYVFSYFSPQL